MRGSDPSIAYLLPGMPSLGLVMDDALSYLDCNPKMTEPRKLGGKAKSVVHQTIRTTNFENITYSQLSAQIGTLNISPVELIAFKIILRHWNYGQNGETIARSKSR